MPEPEEQKQPAAPAEEPPPDPNLVTVLSDGTKVKRRVPRQRACTELTTAKKAKIDAGHLKRFYELSDEVKQKFGAQAEVYRCEKCHTLYLPHEEETPRTGTLAY